MEKKAYRITQIAIGQTDETMDIVQDAMLKLVQKYSHKSEQDWPGLFYTILNSRINDWFRKTQVRNRWRVWFGTKTDEESGSASEFDPLETASDSRMIKPDEHMEFEQSALQVDALLAALPLRQKQAFLLRMWEGFNVEETAKIMKCSQGSVKTHLARALSKLRADFARIGG